MSDRIDDPYKENGVKCVLILFDRTNFPLEELHNLLNRRNLNRFKFSLPSQLKLICYIWKIFKNIKEIDQTNVRKFKYLIRSHGTPMSERKAGNIFKWKYLLFSFSRNCAH